jgi:hypothetical protein
MNITTKKLLSISVATFFILMVSALSMGILSTNTMADEAGIKTVTFGVT